MPRLISALALAAVLVLPTSAQAGKPYVLGNVGVGTPTVAAGPAGVYHVVWNDERANVFHYCQVLKGKSGCAKSTVLAFNDSPDGGLTGAPDKAWIVRDIDAKVLYLVHPQYVSGDTYVWTSVDDGTSFTGPTKVWGGVNGGPGTDSQRPLYFPAGKSIAFPSVNPGLFAFEAPVDGSMAASESQATLNQQGLGIRGYRLGLATLEDRTLATADDLENLYWWDAGNGEDLSATPTWGGPTFIGSGYDSSMHGQAGDAYLAYTVRHPKGWRFEIRKWGGLAFGKAKVLANTNGYQGNVYVSENGSPAAIYRDNKDGLHYSYSADGGKTYATKLVTNSDEVYFDLNMAHDDDGAGLAVWTREGAIAAADLTSVADPSAPPVSKTVTKNGVTTGLNVPGTCVVGGKKYTVSTGGQGRGRLKKVRYRFGGQQQTDTKPSWGATFTVPKSVRSGAVIKVSSLATFTRKSTTFSVSISTTVTVCGA